MVGKYYYKIRKLLKKFHLKLGLPTLPAWFITTSYNAQNKGVTLYITIIYCHNFFIGPRVIFHMFRELTKKIRFRSCYCRLFARTLLFNHCFGPQAVIFHFWRISTEFYVKIMSHENDYDQIEERV